MKRTISAMEARRKLGEMLEGVYYRGDEVVIERNGKVMGVVISPDRYAGIERRRRRVDAMIQAAQNRNKDLAPEVIEREVAKALREVRARAAKPRKSA